MSSALERRERASGGGGGGAAAGLFVARWLKNPLRMGSVVPSSRSLGRLVARHLRAGPDEWVLEIGAGTGTVTRAILEGGHAPERLAAVEIEGEMARHLRRTYPGVRVMEDDAFALDRTLPDAMRGRVGDAICGIPLVLLPLERQRRFVDVVEAVAPGRGFLLYTYCATSPLPWRKLGLRARREGFTPLNLPPASVWRYTPA